MGSTCCKEQDGFETKQQLFVAGFPAEVSRPDAIKQAESERRPTLINKTEEEDLEAKNTVTVTVTRRKQSVVAHLFPDNTA